MSSLINEVLNFINALDIVTGSADRNGAVLDLAGFDGYLCVVKLGTVVAGSHAAKLQHGDASDLSDAADITGATQAIAATDDNKFIIFDVLKPSKRYHRLVMDKDATNNVTEGAIYIPYGANKPAVTHAAAELLGIVKVAAA